MFKCLFAHKFGELDNGIQRCIRCGLLKRLPEKPHVCKFEDIKTFEVEIYDTIYGQEIGDRETHARVVQKCNGCGELRTFDQTTGRYCG